MFGEGNAYRSIHIQPKNDVAANENNGLTLVLNNNSIDISRLVEGKTYYENQICIVGVFPNNITAENNTVIYAGETLSQKVAWVGVNTTGVNGDGGKWEYWDDAKINEELAFSYIIPVSTTDELKAAIVRGGEIKLTDDISGAGIVFAADGKPVVIDLAGHTIKFNSGVGSANTQTNGFQILKGNKVTL